MDISQTDNVCVLMVVSLKADKMFTRTTDNIKSCPPVVLVEEHPSLIFLIHIFLVTI
uniref:Uncharacterized protein n=1 Tax=Strigamia maritima TaxID=126957 RepID=T1JJY7_STRMM